MIALRDTRPVLRFLIYKNMTTVETDTSLSLNGMELDKEADNSVAFEELLAAIGNATGGVVRDAGGRCQPFFPLIYKVLHLCFLRGSAPSAFGGFPRGFLGPQRCSLWRAVGFLQCAV